MSDGILWLSLNFLIMHLRHKILVGVFAVLVSVGYYSSHVLHRLSLQAEHASAQVPPAVPQIPVRELTLDTASKSLFLSDYNSTSDQRGGSLIEYTTDGQQLHTWKIKYEQKGHSRAVCDPPV